MGQRPAQRARPASSRSPCSPALAAVDRAHRPDRHRSTTYNEPFHLARKFASLDHISGGRAGWNIVTSASEAEARNFGRDARPEHADRYERAAEFLDVATKLWDSWEDDALVLDTAQPGSTPTPTGSHPIDHSGEHFQVRGPLNMPRPPQGHPLLVQAGSSEDGKEFAARYAEAVFTAQQTLADGQAFYADLKAAARPRYGRDPDAAARSCPASAPIIGAHRGRGARSWRRS